MDLTGVDPSDQNTFRMNSAIAMAGANATVHRNTIVGASIGVVTFDDGLITGGEDNVIDQAYIGVLSLEDTSIKFNFNDITNSFLSLSVAFISSDLDCNWWGDPAGPNDPEIPAPETFTPWATAPIAAYRPLGMLAARGRESTGGVVDGHEYDPRWLGDPHRNGPLDQLDLPERLHVRRVRFRRRPSFVLRRRHDQLHGLRHVRDHEHTPGDL